jgi:ATP-binding cassette subfamily B protein
MILPHLRRLLPYLRRRRTALAGGLLALLGTTAFAVASPWVLRRAIDDLTLQVTRGKLLLYAGAVLGLVVLEGVLRYLARMLLIGISREIEYELRNDVFAHLTRLEPRYYQTHRIGDLMSRATNDMSAVRMVLGPGIMYAANTLATSAGTIALMLAIHPLLTGLALAPLLLVSVLVYHYGRRIHDRFEEVQAQLAEMNAVVQENLAGVRVVKAYAQEKAQEAQFEAANLEYVSRNRRLIRLTALLYPGIQLLMGLGAVTVLGLGGALVVRGRISLGEFVAFGVYLAMLNWPMIALGWVINIFERGEASLGRLHEILDREPAIRDEAAPSGGRPELRGGVAFRGLTFAYDGAPVLHDVRLEVPAGSTLAIVGPTGAGKSTLVSLLARLYDPPPGTVFLDGHDVRSLPLAILRGAVGFVPQESFLFSDTVGENVAFGLPADAPGREARVVAAGEQAQLAKDVRDFPQGYGTFVGERGLTLSGGQKQRTALARALATDPRVLVLDDALSAVDTETEEDVLRALRARRGERTTLLVSHRVSTVKDADLIVVLRQGRLVELGRHQDLLALDGFYADLHRRQLLEREVETA